MPSAYMLYSTDPLLQVHVPNLGWLITLLTISPKHKWGHLAVPLLMETLDRNVLWSCKEKESLVQHYSIPEHTGGELTTSAICISKMQRSLMVSSI